MNILKKITTSPAEPNYSRRVDYSPVSRSLMGNGWFKIERPHAWVSHDLRKVSFASRIRVHNIMQGMTMVGARGGYKLFK